MLRMMAFSNLENEAQEAVAKQIAEVVFDAIHDSSDDDHDTWASIPKEAITVGASRWHIQRMSIIKKSHRK